MFKGINEIIFNQDTMCTAIEHYLITQFKDGYAPKVVSVAPRGVVANDFIIMVNAPEIQVETPSDGNKSCD